MNNIFNMFNGSFGMFGSRKKKYNPLINYTWEMLPNAKVKNSGTSGVDLQLYSGNPLDFQGSQYIQTDVVTISGDFTYCISSDWDGGTFDIFHGGVLNYFGIANSTQLVLKITSYYYINLDITLTTNRLYVFMFQRIGTTLYAYVDGIQSGSATCTDADILLSKIGNYSSAYKDGVIDSIIAYNGVLTQSQITQSVEQPNQFFKDMSTDVNTLFCTDFGGNSGYIADDRNVSKTILNTNDTFDTDVIGWKSTTAGSSISWDNGRALVDLQDSGGGIVVDQAIIKTIGNYYKITVDTEAGTYPSTLNIGFGNVDRITSQDATKSHSFIVKATDTDSSLKVVRATGNIGTIYVDNFKVEEISSVYPITNYSSTMRINFQTETSGMQELMIERDSLGFFLGLREFPKGNGAGYGDTGWIPSASEDWGIEIAKEFVSTSSYDLCGIASSNINERLYIGKSSSNRLYVRLGASETNTYVMFDNYVISLVYKSATKTADIYHNGVFKVTIGDGLFTTPSNSFLLTEVLNSFYSTTDIRLFKVHNKVLTQEEITNNYNDYVAQGLLQ